MRKSVVPTELELHPRNAKTQGSRTTLYNRCQVEVFARFGECSRWDGLVQRVTQYTDDARTAVTEVHEVFERRKDKLKERRSLPMQDTVVEHFAPRSLFDVKDITTTRGERRTINFYSRARLDGLVRREEIMGVKLSEVFTGRDDRLEYRSATFGAATPAGGPVATASAAAAGGQSASAIAMGSAAAVQQAASVAVDGGGAAAGNGGGGERSLAIVKMSEKFARDPSKPADEDVAKRVFHVAVARTELRHHHGDGRVTAGYVVLQQDGPAQAVQVSGGGWMKLRPEVSLLVKSRLMLRAACVLNARSLPATPRNHNRSTPWLPSPAHSTCCSSTAPCSKRSGTSPKRSATANGSRGRSRACGRGRSRASHWKCRTGMWRVARWVVINASARQATFC